MGIESKTLLNKEIPKLVKESITQVQLVKYAGASGDYNRIHIDEEFAKKTPLKGTIAHGMLSMGFLGQYLDKIAGDVYDVKNFKVRFRSMVRPGDTITCIAEVLNGDHQEISLELKALNQYNDTVISGNAVLLAKE
ncbi:MaoC/PaaZ C-terminal domain-containing protein [Neobacillus sp. M.A.Huq-85]|nr:MaoC/PaaZ C-terminal domain-containing protein [Neobacillus cucumis]